MSRHWNPDEELLRCLVAEESARAQRRPWPEGAVAGLVLVSVACVGLGTLLYQLAGPRQVVEKDVARR